MKKGDLVLVTGHRQIANHKFLEVPIKTRYGRIVEIRIRYNQLDGRKTKQIIVSRADSNGKKYESPIDKRFIKILTIT